MNFLNPFFLLGLLTVAIPVVIHLINLRRPQTISFPTLSFFRELQKSTIRRIRIKQYLLLALRVLAIIFLGMALARPFISSSISGTMAGDESSAIVIMVDNSPSMSRIGPDGPFIDQAKEVAQSIVDNAGEEDRFVILTTNGSIGTMLPVGGGRAAELVDGIKISESGNYIGETLGSFAAQLKKIAVQSAFVYLVTDAQKSQLDNLQSVEREIFRQVDKPFVLQPVLIGGVSQHNVAVSDISLKSQILGRGSPLSLQVGIRNFGSSTAAKQFVSVEVGERMIGQYEVDLKPGENRELLFEMIPEQVGSLSGRVFIEGDEITYDNERFFSISIPRSRSVLYITEQEDRNTDFISYLNPALEAARQSDSQIQIHERTPHSVDQSEWLQNDIIVLDGLREIPEYWFGDLRQFVQDGKGVLFFPSEQGSIQNYNRFLGLFNAGTFSDVRGSYGSFQTVARVNELEEGHPILNNLFMKEDEESINVDLPELFYYYRYEQESGVGSYSILTSDLGDRILAEQQFGDGKLLVSAMGTDPGWSNFPVNPLFAPIYYRAVIYTSSTEVGGLAEHQLGEVFEWEGDIDAENLTLTLNGETYEPEIQGASRGVRVRHEAKEWEPGFLRLQSGDLDYTVAVNQHIMESDFTTLDKDTLDKYLNNTLTVNSVIDVSTLNRRSLENELSSASAGKEVWSWFVWVALAFLLAETVISRVYKAETIT